MLVLCLCVNDVVKRAPGSAGERDHVKGRLLLLVSAHLLSAGRPGGGSASHVGVIPSGAKRRRGISGFTLLLRSVVSNCLDPLATLGMTIVRVATVVKRVVGCGTSAGFGGVELLGSLGSAAPRSA